MSTLENRCVILAGRPKGVPGPEFFKLETVDALEPGDGEFLIHNKFRLLIQLCAAGSTMTELFAPRTCGRRHAGSRSVKWCRIIRTPRVRLVRPVRLATLRHQHRSQRDDPNDRHRPVAFICARYPGP